MADVARLARYQQRVEELSAASIRTLADDTKLSWRRQVLYHDELPLLAFAPHLRVPASARDLTTLRGVGDAYALRLRYSDPVLFRQGCPEPPIERLLFELLEQLRCEALAPAELPGVQANVQHRFETWSREFYHSGITETDLGMLVYTVAQMVWSRLNAQPVMAETEERIEVKRGSIAPLVGTSLAGLRRHRHDQVAYMPYARELAYTVAALVQSATESRDEQQTARELNYAFALLLDFDDEPIEGPVSVPSGESRVFRETGSVYRVFTTQFDQEVDASSQVRRELLRDYRHRLDGLVSEQGVNRSRLRRLLLHALASPQVDGRDDAQEEGQIDGRRLAHLVSSPTERRLFTLPRHVYQANCAVTFLLDCSGSMKEHVSAIAVLVDVMTRALEQAGAVTEILGFTTGAWNGGRAYREWLRHGRPALPGRLNEVCYRIFKSQEQSWRQSRASIAALFKSDLYREGIDGEAVQWAAERMLSRDRPRRLLVVISDGCPMDTATALNNDDFYLDNHLKQVVSQLERTGQIEISGIGVGLDLSPFYRRNVAIDVTSGLQNQAIYDVANLLRPAQ